MTQNRGTDIFPEPIAKKLIVIVGLLLIAIVSATAGEFPGAGTPLALQVTGPLISSQNQVREILFVDGEVPGFDPLRVAMHPGVQIVVLTRDRDGIVQITETLKSKAPLDAVHIVSHGSPGAVYLGGATLDAGTVDGYADNLTSWRANLTETADILIYGCNVAGTPEGRKFLARVAELTGADVAASTDNTGAAALGGDWELEAVAGDIEAGLFAAYSAVESYPALLASDQNFDGFATVNYGASATFGSFTISGNGSTAIQVDTGSSNYLGPDNHLVFDWNVAADITLVTIETTDGTSFKMAGLEIDTGFGDTTYTLRGYRDGMEVNTAVLVLSSSTSNGGVTYTEDAGVPVGQGSLAFTGWDNIDKITLEDTDTGAGGNLDTIIDDIDVSDAVSTVTISNLNGDSFSYSEGDGAAVIDQGTAATVSDADATGYNGGNLTVTISAGEDAAEDVLSLDTAGTVSLSGTEAGSTVSVVGTPVGTLGNTISAGNDLVVNLNADATDARLGTLVQAITYENSDTANPTTGARTIDVTVTDAVNATSSVARVTVTVSAVNDDPAMSGLPTDITVVEDTASNVDLSAATFADVDSGANSITLTLAAGTGTLTATSGGSVTVGGSGTGTLTLTGTVSNIDTFLNTASNIRYNGSTDVNGNDADTITLTANDGGNTGTGGGADVAMGTVNVDITAVNDNPAMSGLPTDITVTEETAGNVDLSAATLSDIDSDAGSITLTLAAGTGILTATSGGSVTVGGSGTGTLTLTGTVSNIDTFLNTASNIRYTGASNVSGDNADTVSVTANDGGNTGTGGGGNVSLGTVNVDITAVNDDPTMSGLPTDITVVEDTASNVDLSAATFADVDSGANSITLTLAAGTGTLTATSGGSVTVGGSGTGTLTLTGTVSNIDTFLNTASNIRYTGASNESGDNADTISLTANDGGNTGTGGGGNVSLGTVNVDITAVNDPPVVGGVFGDNSSQVVAGAGAQNVTDLADATLENIDSPDYNGGFLAITQGSGTANGSWGLDGTTTTSGGDAAVAAGETVAVGGVSVGTVHATNDGQGGDNLQISFNSANATSARIQTLLRALTYSAPSGLGARTFTLTLNDNDGTANGGDQDASGNFTITVTPNPPVISNLDGDSLSAANNTAVAIDAGGNATVTDADSPNFNGGNLTIARTAGLAGNFSLSGSGSSSVSSGSSLGTADGTIAGSEIIYVDGVAIASVSSASNGQGTNTLLVNFGSNATPARVQALIRALRYGSTTGGAHTFDLTVTDASSNAATSAVSSFTVTINAAPVITGQAVLTTFGSTPLAITLGDLVVSDADNSYPADFTLSVQDGASYSRSGATITPDDGFAGDLTVPVTVNDGTDDSNLFNLSIYVASTRVVTETTDSGAGSLRQALADAGDNDVIDLSLVGGTIVLSSGPLIIDKDLTIYGAAESAVTISGDNTQRVLTVSGADVTLTDLTIADGMSIASGGGIHNTGTLTLVRVTLSDNQTTGGDGGGIYNAGTLAATNTTVSGNLASGNGGGIANDGTATLNHGTIAANHADNSAGGLHNSGDVNMSNTIIADNTPGDCGDSGTIVSNVANLIADGTCSPDVAGDPSLGPLQDNFGSTFTHALTAGSPAIDAADAGTSESTDQRNESRPVDGDGDGVPDADIGAFEYQPSGDTGVVGERSSGGGGCFLGTIIRFR